MATHRRGQRVVGGLQAHPHGVAAHGGRLAHVQDRPERRGLQEGHVGVPPRGPVLAPVDVQDLGIALDRRDHRVRRRHLAELAGEVGLHVGGEVLAREEQHQVTAQRGAHLGHHVVAQRTAQVETPHLGPDVGGDRPDVETCRQRHASMVPQRGAATTHGPPQPMAHATHATPAARWPVAPWAVARWLRGSVAPVGPASGAMRDPRRADRAEAPPCLPGRRRPSRISCGHDGEGRAGGRPQAAVGEGRAATGGARAGHRADEGGGDAGRGKGRRWRVRVLRH